MGNLFSDLLKELQIRRSEKAKLASDIEEEKHRIEIARTEAKKSVFRKISVVDKLGSKIDEKADSTHLEQYKNDLQKRMLSSRALRKKKMIADHKVSLIVISLLAVVFVAGTLALLIQAENRSYEEKYNNAINALQNNNYNEVIEIIGESTYKESKKIKDYTKLLMSETKDPKDAAKLVSNIINLPTFENPELKSHFEDTVNRLTRIRDEYEEDLRLKAEAEAKAEAEKKAREEAAEKAFLSKFSAAYKKRIKNSFEFFLFYKDEKTVLYYSWYGSGGNSSQKVKRTSYTGSLGNEVTIQFEGYSYAIVLKRNGSGMDWVLTDQWGRPNNQYYESTTIEDAVKHLYNKNAY